MANVVVPLGSAGDLTQLFSYPNVPGSTQSLSDTITHWFGQTLERDGFTADTTFVVGLSRNRYVLTVSGPDSAADSLQKYATLVPQFLKNGKLGIAGIAKVKAATPPLWDPKNDGWRFMLPLGLPMINQKSLQLFHYPPMNLLDPLQDYLNDPVPARWAELLTANGMKDMSEIILLERLVDCAPVAGSDDQGTLISPMLTPVNYFEDYQKAQFRLMLNASSANPAYTIPIIVCGGPAREVFNAMFKTRLGVNQTATVRVLRGKTTAVLAANHPYRFYATAQGFDTIGCGNMSHGDCVTAVMVMQADLISARWQMLMAQNPAQDTQAVLASCKQYWSDPAQAGTICGMVQHEGSLYYKEQGNPSDWTFSLSLEQAAALCKSNGNNPCTQTVQ